ncbi:MAG: hypothetical protein M0037_16095 [Betaproteobacteria bacterium]|nr:hypothetical protein [Betaproteobacteria bacterium]
MKTWITHPLCSRALSVGLCTVALGLAGTAPLYAAELHAAPHNGTNGLAGSVANLCGHGGIL